MTAEPPAAPRSLISEAGRERLVGLLREHYAQGRLDDDQLSTRVGMVLTAEFTDQAAAAVADLPVLAVPAAATGQSRRRRGYAEAAAPGPGWVPTAERFRDPTTRVIMRVWLDPADQSRHYVPDANG